MTPTQREEWLRVRQTGIGSSDAAEILGLGYSGTDGPGKVYRSKVEPPDLRPPTGVQRRGIELEPIAARIYTEETGAELELTPLIRHPERAWQIASNDRTRLDDGRKVEIKTVGWFTDEWGPPQTQQVPLRYWIQVQHQMVVAGATDIDLFALGSNIFDTRLYRIDLDPAYAAWLTEVESAFWGMVEDRHEPQTGDWLMTVDLMAGKPKLPAIYDDTDLDLNTEGWIQKANSRHEAVLDRDGSVGVIKELTGHFLNAMQGHVAAKAGPWRIRRRRRNGEWTDSLDFRRIGQHEPCSFSPESP